MTAAPIPDDLVSRSEELQAPVSVVRAAFSSWEGRTGVVLAVLMVILILFGPSLAPYPPEAIGVGPQTQGPSLTHIFGTDNLGRDVLSRFLMGGRTVLVVPLLAVLLSFVLGGGAGMVGAYIGGSVDRLIVGAFDILLAVPPLLLVLVLISGLGSAYPVLILSVALTFAPRVGRVIRGATQAVVSSDFVSAAQARGERSAAILVREVLPNIIAPAIADFALRVTYAVIFVASLNFLGLGAQPPSSDWGLMVGTYRAFLPVQPWATLAPALGIALLSIAMNLVADAITRHVTRGTSQGAVPL